MLEDGCTVLLQNPAVRTPSPLRYPPRCLFINREDEAGFSAARYRLWMILDKGASPSGEMTMNKLTIMNTITKSAPLALLTVVISSSAFAGPPVGDPARPKGEKLGIEVENHCVPNGRYLDATTVTLSDSKKGDGGGEITTPTADAMFKGRVCDTNKGGKEKCSIAFLPVGATDQDMYYAGSLKWTRSIDLCATKDDETLGKETAVNALISVPVAYDDGSTTTWVSNCDDIDRYEDYEWVMVGDQLVWMDVVDQSEVELETELVCPPVG
jgi:hypothetical protein